MSTPPTRQDDLGIWYVLGELRLEQHDLWQKFPYRSFPAQGNLSYIEFIYRLTFYNCGDFDQTVSNAYLQNYWEDGKGSILTGVTVKLIPRKDPYLLRFSIPRDFIFRGITYQDFRIKKLYWKNWERTPAYLWSVRLEELVN